MIGRGVCVLSKPMNRPWGSSHDRVHHPTSVRKVRLLSVACGVGVGVGVLMIGGVLVSHQLALKVLNDAANCDTQMLQRQSLEERMTAFELFPTSPLRPDAGSADRHYNIYRCSRRPAHAGGSLPRQRHPANPAELQIERFGLGHAQLTRACAGQQQQTDSQNRIRVATVAVRLAQ